MNIVILGCGRVASWVASQLQQEHQVTVIDWNAAAFERLPAQFSGSTVVGNGIDVDVLRSAGVENAHIFLALTDGDNRNLMASQLAAQLGVEQVVARVYDAERSSIFSDMGVTTVSPTVIGAERLFRIVTTEDN